MDEGGAIRLGVDVGGTFTDVVLVVNDAVVTSKVLTTSDQSVGVFRGIERACAEAGIEPASIDEFRHATTVATNAILEDEGATVDLVTTAGVADVIEIARQDRPSLYDLSARKPDPLVPPERRHEVAERTTPTGVESRLAVDSAVELRKNIDEDCEAVAIAFLHAYAHPENEKRLANALRESLDVPVVASHETLAEFREYERTATTVVDAAVTPVIDRYLTRLLSGTREREMVAPQIMQSNGGIAPADRVRQHAVWTVLSGPAAGVVGAPQFGGSNADLISFDMGGTSTDVGVIRNGEAERTTDGSIGGHPIAIPMVDVETVGAGGGSIAWVDAGGALRVGPQSAGANPGPACYGRGGTDPTVTDAALVLGHLGSETLAETALTLDREAATAALADLATATTVDAPWTEPKDLEPIDRPGLPTAVAVAVAKGVRRVAVTAMARAVRRVTIERGVDPRSFVLVAFGGAGPMHACALADRLDIETIRVPKATGVLSGLGLLTGDERYDASRTHTCALEEVDRDAIETAYATLERQARPDQQADSNDSYRSNDGYVRDLRADLRYTGQSHELTVTIPKPFDAATVRERFHAAHERVRGFRLEDEPIDLITLRLSIRIPRERPSLTHSGTTTEPTSHRQTYFTDQPSETPIFSWEQLRVDTRIEGPAICEGGESTVVVEPGWYGRVDSRGTLCLEVNR